MIEDARIRCQGCEERVDDLEAFLADVDWAAEWTWRHSRHGEVVITIPIPVGQDAAAIARRITDAAGTSKFGGPVAVDATTPLIASQG